MLATKPVLLILVVACSVALTWIDSTYFISEQLTVARTICLNHLSSNSSKEAAAFFRQALAQHHPDKGGDEITFNLLHKSKQLVEDKFKPEYFSQIYCYFPPLSPELIRVLFDFAFPALFAFVVYYFGKKAMEMNSRINPSQVPRKPEDVLVDIMKLQLNSPVDVGNDVFVEISKEFYSSLPKNCTAFANEENKQPIISTPEVLSSTMKSFRSWRDHSQKGSLRRSHEYPLPAQVFMLVLVLAPVVLGNSQQLALQNPQIVHAIGLPSCAKSPVASYFQQCEEVGWLYTTIYIYWQPPNEGPRYFATERPKYIVDILGSNIVTAGILAVLADGTINAADIVNIIAGYELMKDIKEKKAAVQMINNYALNFHPDGTPQNQKASVTN